MFFFCINYILIVHCFVFSKIHFKRAVKTQFLKQEQHWLFCDIVQTEHLSVFLYMFFICKYSCLLHIVIFHVDSSFVIFSFPLCLGSLYKDLAYFLMHNYCKEHRAFTRLRAL